MARKRLGTRLVLVAFLGASLLIASHATSAPTTVRATATITGSGTSYRLTVRNTGDEPILCFGLLLDGVQPIAASGPTGVLTRVGTFQGRGLVHMQGNATTPAVPAGGTANVDFQTNVAIPPNAGGEIRYSATCQPGSDQIGRATGPTGSTPPPPPVKPKCQCKSLKITKAEVSRFPFDLKLDLSWNLACAPKDGGRCEARIRVVPPTKKFAIKMLPRDGNVSCKGTCKARNKGESAVRMDFGRPFSLNGETLRFRLRKFCKRGLVYIPAGSQTTTVAFDEEGDLDRVQSDLNANGVPDGDEKR